MEPPPAKSPRAKVLLTVEPLLVKTPEPAALPNVWLALRIVNVPVVAPILILVPACRAVTVAALVLNSPRVVALVAMVAELRLMLPVPAVRVTPLPFTLLPIDIAVRPVPAGVPAPMRIVCVLPFAVLALPMSMVLVAVELPTVIPPVLLLVPIV